MNRIACVLFVACLPSISTQAASATITAVAAGPGVSNTLFTSNQLLFPPTLVGSPSPALSVNASAGVSNPSNVIITQCVISGAHASDFSQTPAITTPLVVTPGATINIPLVFTPTTAGARNAMLTCSLTDGPSASFSTLLNGTAVPREPLLIPNPPTGTTINASGLAGTTLSRVVSFANVSNTLQTVSCTATGAGFDVIGSPLTVAAGAQGSITVSGTSSTPATLTGELNCTSDLSEQFIYPLSFVFGTPAVTQIPLIDHWGRWTLLGLCAGVGMIFALRKRG